MSNSWEYVSSKLGSALKPETRAKAKEIFDAAAKAGHEIWFMWGMGNSSEHKTGRALDLMVRNEAAGDWVRNYIWANRARLRLQHVIWEQHITSTVTQPGVRRKMPDRGNSTENHYDHNHVLFLTGAYVAPGKPTAPKPTTPAPKPPTVPNPAKPGEATRRVVNEIIDGEWGNGDERKRRLKAAGWNNYAVLQALVNAELRRRGRARKTPSAIANEVIGGRWGNGVERQKRLIAAGYNPAEIQAIVNARVR